MFRYYYCAVFLTFFSYVPVISSESDVCDTSGHEKPTSMRLKEDLLCDYDRTVRPVTSHKNVTNVSIQIMMHHYDLLEYTQKLDIDCWFLMRWDDEHLTWKPEDYNNIAELFLTTDDIWVPDISQYNHASYQDPKIIGTSHCLVTYDGRVLCVVTTYVGATCVPDLKYWPFDIQNCTMKFGSWYYPGEEISLQDAKFIKSDALYHDNLEWDLVSTSLRSNQGHLACCPNDTYPDIVISLLVKRHITGMFATVVLPYLVLIFLTILTVWLDPRSSDRIYVTALNITCHIIFLLNSSFEVSESGDIVPYLILLLRNSELIATITLIETLVVRYLLRNTNDSPAWLVISLNRLVTTKAGQLLLFSELNPEGAAANLSGDDSTNLMDEQERPKEWYLFGKVIDRTYFVVILVAYFIMFILCIPK